MRSKSCSVVCPKMQLTQYSLYIMVIVIPLLSSGSQGLKLSTLPFTQPFIDMVKNLSYVAADGAASNNITEKCVLQLNKFLLDLRLNEQSWALSMLDATSKIPSGILQLNLEDMGNFQQCIEVQSSKKSSTPYDDQILGKYCLGFVELMPAPDPETQDLTDDDISISDLTEISKSGKASGPTWAVCAPNGCTSTDINILVNNVLKVYLDGQIRINFPEMLCQTSVDVNGKWSIGAILTLTLILSLFSLVIFATTFDLYCVTYDKEPPHLILIAFSAYTNGIKVFDMSSKETSQFSCLNGIRFISMMWVVTAHTYSIPASGAIYNSRDLVKWTDNLFSMLWISGTISVDSFFVVGGCLMSYGFLRARSKKVHFNLFKYYVHRYIRLTPPLAMVVLVSATLISYMGSGPKWPFLQQFFQGNCIKYWWSVLLYTQNYVNVREMCVGQSWYLAIDMQLYFASPPIFYVLWKYPKIGLSLLSACILIFIGIPFYVSWTNKITAILTNFYGNADTFSNDYYLLTHTRAAPWFIGVILGYYMFKIQTKETIFQPSKKMIAFLWIITMVTLITCVFAGHNNLRGKEYDYWGNSLHLALVRPVWSIAVSWVILACISGYGGPVNWFLSLPIYTVFNRFTYGVYLAHVTLMYMIMFSTKTPEYFSGFNIIYNFWGTFFISTGLATLLVFMVEAPMLVIEKIIFGERSREKSVDFIGRFFKGEIENRKSRIRVKQTQVLWPNANKP